MMIVDRFFSNKKEVRINTNVKKKAYTNILWSHRSIDRSIIVQRGSI